MAQIDVRGMRVAIYLRKSRADLDDESKGHGDTLARHRKTLLALADRLHVAVGKIYPEVVSGETIASRPQMQALLHDLEAGLWDAVLVVEVPRLTRGSQPMPSNTRAPLLSHRKKSTTRTTPPMKICWTLACSFPVSSGRRSINANRLVAALPPRKENTSVLSRHMVTSVKSSRTKRAGRSFPTPKPHPLYSVSLTY